MKVVVLLSVAAWAIWADLEVLARLSGLEPRPLARAAGTLLHDLTGPLALTCLALGVADFALQWRRHENQLRMTPDQHREEQRSSDGDPALRSRRRRLALSWRHDPADVLAGASLLVNGPGLAILLAGGPPPLPLTVRTVARGAEATRLRRSAFEAGIPLAESVPLVHHFARGPAAGPLPPPLAEELATLWPMPHPPAPETGQRPSSI